MDRDVFLSLLALDSYNLGYDQNIGSISTTGCVGTAEIVSDALIELDRDSVLTAGFYAIACDWNGETIISYRSTNFDTQFDPVSDALKIQSLSILLDQVILARSCTNEPRCISTATLNF